MRKVYIYKKVTSAKAEVTIVSVRRNYFFRDSSTATARPPVISAVVMKLIGPSKESELSKFL